MSRVLWKSGLLTLILVPASIFFSLSYQGNNRAKRGTGPCQGRVRLSPVGPGNDSFSLFFLETSGRPVLDGRQACAVESAVDRAGEQVTVFMNSDYLELTDNATCQLYLKSLASGKDHKRLTFLKIDIKQDFQGNLANYCDMFFSQSFIALFSK